MCALSLMLRRVAVLIVLMPLVLAGMPAVAQPARPECVQLLEERLKIVQALDKLNGIEFPSDKIRDLQALMAELKSALGSTGTDSAAAAKKVEDAIDKVKRVMPQAEGPLKQIAKGLKDAKTKIDDVLKPIEAFGKALDVVDKYYQQTESGSAADLVRALGNAFDEIRSVLPVKAVPGLNALFDAYKQSIDAIATSAAQIEDRVHDMNATMRELQRTDGDGFGILVPVYLPADGPRGRIAKQKQALDRMLAALDGRLDANGCQRPGSPNTPDFSADSCAPSKDDRASIALEIARRRVANLERQADQARDTMLQAWRDMQNPAVRDADAQSRIEKEEARLSNAEAAVAELERDIARAKEREAFAKRAAAGVQGAEREGWEQMAKDEWMKYTVWEQQALPRARRTAASAREALAKAKAEAPLTTAAYEAAKARYAAARSALEALQTQIGQAIAAVLKQAAELEKWTEAEHISLKRCRDHYFPQERIKHEIDTAMADQSDNSGQCPASQPQPSGSGMIGGIDHVIKGMDAAGCGR